MSTETIHVTRIAGRDVYGHQFWVTLDADDLAVGDIAEVDISEPDDNTAYEAFDAERMDQTRGFGGSGR